MKLEVTRQEAIQIRVALTTMVIGYKEELREENLTEDRKKIAESSLKMWEELRQNIIDQISESV